MTVQSLRWLLCVCFCPAFLAQFHFNLSKERLETPILRRRLAPDQEIEVYGDFRQLAYYYADVYIGTPPQKFTVITDTGSSLLAVPCRSCTTCGTHMNPKYSAAESTTANEVACAGVPTYIHCTCSLNKCGYYQGYTEGSQLRGQYWKDQVTVGSEGDSSDYITANAVEHYFGCHTSENGLFKTQLADGIMGLSQSGQSIIQTLHNQNKLSNFLFTMCLADEGGRMSFGEVDTRLHDGPLAYTPLHGSGFYTVTVTGMNVAGSNVFSSSLNRGQGTIVDSGTSFTYLPTDVFSAVKSSITTYCADGTHCKGTRTTVSGEGMCWRLASRADLSTFPTITLTLDGGVTINIPPKNYIIDMVWDNGAYCLGFYENGGSSGVIGGNTMMDHDVVFDLGNRRVGWAPASCHRELAPITPSTSPSPTSSPAAASATPSPSAAPSSTSTASAATTASAAQPSASSTVSSTQSPIQSPSITASPSVSGSSTASPSASVTPSPTSTSTPSASASVVPSSTPTASASVSQLAPSSSSSSSVVPLSPPDDSTAASTTAAPDTATATATATAAAIATATASASQAATEGLGDPEQIFSRSDVNTSFVEGSLLGIVLGLVGVCAVVCMCNCCCGGCKLGPLQVAGRAGSKARFQRLPDNNDSIQAGAVDTRYHDSDDLEIEVDFDEEESAVAPGRITAKPREQAGNADLSLSDSDAEATLRPASVRV